MPIVNSKRESQRGSINGSGFRRLLSNRRRFLPHLLAIAAACVFAVLASYRIELPGLYMDEVDFVNAAQGAPETRRYGPAVPGHPTPPAGMTWQEYETQRAGSGGG